MEKIIKASFRDCALTDRKMFKHSSCLMPISVGQPVHENQKFAATAALINRSFASCTLLVDDTIQRHTLCIDNPYTEKEAYDIAKNMGTEWLIRNKAVLENFTIPTTVLRWDDWLHNADFTEAHDTVKALYGESDYFQSCIQQNIETFLNRYFLRNIANQVDYERAFSLCTTYLLEECAVMSLWPKGNYAFEVYPSGRNQAMHALYELLIQPKHPDLLKSVALRFKKYVPAEVAISPSLS